MNKEQFLAMSLQHSLYAKRMHFGILKYNSVAYSNEFEVHKDNPARECCLPVCHPLSDLTKPITHNGETFVPIVELAKMYYPNHEWKLSSSGLYACVGNGYMTFEYDYGYNCFLCNNSAQLDQLNCLLKTIEWHFDVFGLIEKGEAIDVNILPENPYK